VLHVADAELFRPQPGTTARDHVAAALVPLAVALLAALAYGRLRPGLRAAIALVFGILALVGGLIAVGGALADGLSRAEWTGLVLIPAGVVLLGLAVWLPWSERGRWRRRAAGSGSTAPSPSSRYHCSSSSSSSRSGPRSGRPRSTERPWARSPCRTRT